MSGSTVSGLCCTCDARKYFYQQSFFRKIFDSSVSEIIWHCLLLKTFSIINHCLMMGWTPALNQVLPIIILRPPRVTIFSSKHWSLVTLNMMMSTCWGGLGNLVLLSRSRYVSREIISLYENYRIHHTGQVINIVITTHLTSFYSPHQFQSIFRNESTTQHRYSRNLLISCYIISSNQQKHGQNFTKEDNASIE